MPPAARVTDMHTCPMVTPGVPPIPHVGGPILPPGVPTVLICFLPAATVSDMATCVGPPDVIVKGSAGVLINFLPAARMGDTTAHGGVIVMGAPTVLIGEVGSPSPGAGGLGGIVAGLGVAGLSNPGGANATKLNTAKTALQAMYQKAPAAKAEIDGAAVAVASQMGGAVAAPPPKSPQRALEKIMKEYDGNAAALKDLVRNTIIVPAGQEMNALEALRRALPGDKVRQVKIADPATNDTGYSGINVFVQTDSGLVAEIQINSPQMIFAKETPAVAQSILPPKVYQALANNPALPPGGQGHTLYEAYRAAPQGSPERDAAAAASREYYDTFRRP